ncbi:recombinase XerD [Roseburia inulinivorans]|uniref:Recombinase XerD n=1 Tax=Roseburia inulinivorans TaxID=360807 RepID=A0A3R6ASQ1_9FIRM|nr:recombinase XerD [Roseburia inulinivorans]
MKEKRKPEDCYFLTGTTRCTEPRNVQKHFKTILKHCNLSDYNFHSLRRGFASSCLESGVECKTVSSILGHSSTQITMDLYVHATLKQKAKCVNMF